MATVVTYSGGLRRIEFAATANGPRKVVRLGRVSAKVAETLRARVEALLADRLVGRPHDPELASWLAGLDERMLAKLRAVGLADGVGLSQITLGEFLERCFASLAVKPATRTFYGHTRRNLETYFGRGRLLRDIGAASVDGWRVWLVEHEKLSLATVARRVIAARTLWRRAVRWKLAAENPFVGVKGGHQVNENRKRFIPREVIARVMEAAPDAEWRAIIALARYGGLRTPSEVFALRWGDIDWAAGTIRVPCPKLEHYEHLASRVIPLFPELRGPLLELFELAEPGCEHVITRHRIRSANLRTTFEKIIARAGLTPWPRLFHNLRASRETELMREYDLATVCRWIGNSPTVAARHYATSIDLSADFRRAIGLPTEAQQKAQQTAAASERRAATATGPQCEKPAKNMGDVECGQLCASAVVDRGWAAQDSNP